MSEHCGYEGCSECEQAREIRALRAELAALREGRGALVHYSRLEKAERELREARALLARLTDNYEPEPGCHCDRCLALPDARAFLDPRRDGGGQ